MSKPQPLKGLLSFTLNTTAPTVVEYTKSLPPFTGVARSIQCYENNGFRNFRILTLTIEEGRVTHTAYSDPHMQVEALERLDIMNDLGMLNLNMTWQDKKALSK